MFHVSFLCFNLLIINAFKRWNIQFQCFTFSFNASVQKNTVGAIQKHWGSDLKTLWERFKNTVGAIQKHCGSVKALPQCFKKWNMKLKMKHKSRMFHFPKWLIFNYFITKNETWKIIQKYWKCMDIMWDKLQFKSLSKLPQAESRKTSMYSILNSLSRKCLKSHRWRLTE